jgi:hypothetical protein
MPKKQGDILPLVSSASLSRDFQHPWRPIDAIDVACSTDSGHQMWKIPARAATDFQNTITGPQS